MSAVPDTSSDPDNSAGMPLVSAGSSDRCVACGAHLAVDQRYCVECGTRRGAPRFQLSGPSSGGAQAERMPPPPKAGLTQRIMRPGASTVMLLGLFILLLALGVGVLIGHNGNTKPAKAANVTVIETAGGSSAGSAAPTTAATSGAGSSSSTGSSSSSSSKKSPGAKTTASAGATPTTAAAKKTAAAATKIGGAAATSKSTVGSACTAGTSGCVNGKQTGNLFGG